MGKFFVLVTILIIFPPFSQAAEIVEYGRSIRALGMGNAYITIVDDKDSLFYNPAGLGRVEGFTLTVMDPYLGADGQDVVTTVSDSSKGSQKQADWVKTLNGLYGKNLWVGLGGKVAFAMPGFAVSLYDEGEFGAYLTNPAFPSFNVRFTNDYGVSAGVGFDMGGVVQMGFEARRINRLGGAFPIGVTDLAKLSNDEFVKQLSNKGTGYSASMGLNFVIPAPVKPTFSFVWKNIGQTVFTKDEGSVAPPSMLDDISAGFGFHVNLPLLDIRPAFEMKHINLANEQLGKKIHAGVELGFPIASVRGGFSQGYYTIGASIDLALFRFDIATYGVELGDYPGKKQHRRYLAQITMELGFDPNFSFLGGGGSGSAAKRRVKVRR